MDKRNYQYEGMKWLHEMELLNHPQVINTVRFNILMTSKRIKEVELLIYRENKSMLVLLELSWLGNKFFKRQIFEDVQDSLTQLLPSFRFRVTTDPKIMEMAVELVKKALTGGTREKDSNSSGASVPVDPSAKLDASAQSLGSSGSPEGSKPNSEEQSINPDAILPYVGTGDSRKE
jgi:hypothetical protein